MAHIKRYANSKQTLRFAPRYTVFAQMRKKHFLYTPQEGAVLIPSYFCARKSLPEDVARYIANEILCQELCDFYVANGDLILYPACTTLHSKQETGLFACPSAKWLEALDPEEFLAMYTKHLPSAVNVF